MKIESCYISEANKLVEASISSKFLQIIRKVFLRLILYYSHLFIAAYDVESPESLLIEIPEKKA